MNHDHSDHFDEYYSYEKLINDISQLSETKINQFEKLSHELNYQGLFEFAIDNTLIDLAEYLYIFHQTTLSLNKLNQIALTKINEQQSNSVALEESIFTEFGGNSGLNLQYWDRHNDKLTLLKHRLLTLRKYSRMESHDKDFFYTFKLKYIEKIFC